MSLPTQCSLWFCGDLPTASCFGGWKGPDLWIYCCLCWTWLKYEPSVTRHAVRCKGSLGYLLALLLCLVWRWFALSLLCLIVHVHLILRVLICYGSGIQWEVYFCYRLKKYRNCASDTENLFTHVLGLNVKVLSAGNARSSQAAEAYINNGHRFQQS